MLKAVVLFPLSFFSLFAFRFNGNTSINGFLSLSLVFLSCLYNIFFLSFVNSFLLFFSLMNVFFFSRSLSLPLFLSSLLSSFFLRGGAFGGGVTLPLPPSFFSLFLAAGVLFGVMDNHVERD